MSDIARRLTGCTATELLEVDNPSLRFANQFVVKPGTIPRNVRIMVGLVEGIGDRESERSKLRLVKL